MIKIPWRGYGDPNALTRRIACWYVRGERTQGIESGLRAGFQFGIGKDFKGLIDERICRKSLYQVESGIKSLDIENFLAF